MFGEDFPTRRDLLRGGAALGLAGLSLDGFGGDCSTSHGPIRIRESAAAVCTTSNTSSC